jgi:V/A-type H+-transporting ATPase subunit K
MISKRLAKYVFLGTFLGVLLVPAVALAQAAEPAAATTMADAVKTIGAALAMGLSAIGAGWAQARIGSAGQGTLAERPEERVFVLTLTALPEVIALLGFVMAIILNG